MQIEAGKYYRTRDGRKVGPMTGSPHDTYPLMGCVDGSVQYWTEGGCYSNVVPGHPLDLIEEWTDEPAKPELPKFDVEKLGEVFAKERRRHDTHFGLAGDDAYKKALLAVANYAAEQVLNPPKDPVEVLAKALKKRFRSEGYAALARHILETYPDAHERL